MAGGGGGTIAADEVAVAVEEVAVDVAAESFCGMNNESRVTRHAVCNVGCEWRGMRCVCVCGVVGLLQHCFQLVDIRHRDSIGQVVDRLNLAVAQGKVDCSCDALFCFLFSLTAF